MITIIRPRRFPHRGRRIYTLTGFRRRVVLNLRREGFKQREVERLEQLYFGCREVVVHQDELGGFTNKRKFRLHALSRRQMKYDRKNPLFDLVIRSGMFYVYVDDNGRLLRFVSPRSFLTNGVILFD